MTNDVGDAFAELTAEQAGYDVRPAINYARFIAPTWGDLSALRVTDAGQPGQRVAWEGTDGWPYVADLYEVDGHVVVRVRSGLPDEQVVWHLDPRTTMLELIANGCTARPVVDMRS